jgi:hypothetical protein
MMEGSVMNNSRKISPALFFFIVFLAALVQAAEAPLASQKFVQALKDEVSGEMAYRYTDSISRFDRVQASEGFHDAAVWIKSELEKMGYKDIALEGWPSDGTKRYYTCRSVIGWKAKSAELWMTSPERERLCSFEEVPLTLVKHSGSGHAETELVDVGSGMGEAPYRGKDVKGKIVLATGPTSEVMREAVLQRGALGVLTYFSADTRPGYPNMIRYTALWPRWEDREKLGFAFNLSKNQGAVLKRILEEGKKVVLKADVETEFHQTKLEVLSAAFPGASEPEKEIMIIGHLCHPTPSANDNASGSGSMLEMARALKVLVNKGLLDAPRRTIRFVWVPELNGTIPYVQAHLDRTRNTLAVINCDMIGEDFHKTSGMFGIFNTPDSMPSFLNDVTANFAGLVEGLGLTSLNGSTHPFAWRSYPYSGGSDHLVFNDGALKVPSVMFNRGDTFHHTSLDTMDKVDPTELRRASVIALGSACYLAAAGEKEAVDMARLVARNGLGRFSADYYDSLAALYDAGDADSLLQAYRQVMNVISHSGKREVQAVLSTMAFVKDQAVMPEIIGLRGHFDESMLSYPKEANLIYKKRCAKLGVMPKPMAFTEEEKKYSRLVPVRAASFVCPLDPDYLVEKMGPDAVNELKLRGDAAYEALNFVDGKKSVHDIALAVSAEYGPTDIQQVHDFFRLLEKAGLVTFKKV